MVRLFIENKEVELDNTVQFAITKQFEDLSNPTDIINDWSKTVSIPFTQKNNELFGHIYNPDKVIVDGGTIGIYFNPLLKLNFRLEWNNAILMTGYAKMNTVKQKKGKGTYEITLFGQLGKIFQEIKKISFDKSISDTDYLIDGSQYVEETINKELVYNSWISTGQHNEELLDKNDSGYSVYDIIGFAPNNSFSDEFDYKTYQYETNKSKEFTDTLGNSFTNATGIEPSTVIPNGLLPREIGEYRSYLQLPFIYFNKLFKIFQAKAEQITGYQFELDNYWFNTNNPYWYNLVYMLKAFNLNKGKDYNNTYSISSTGNLTNIWNASGEYGYSPIIHGDVYYGGVPTLNVNEEHIEIFDNGYFDVPKYGYITVSNNTGIPMRIKITRNRVVDSSNRWKFYTNEYLIVNVCYEDENGNEITETKQQFYVSTNGNSEWVPSTATLIQLSELNIPEPNGSGTWEFSIPYSYKLQYSVATKARLKVTYKFLKHVNDGSLVFAYYRGEFGEDDWQYGRPAPIEISLKPTDINVIVSEDVFISNSYFSLNDLWNNDYNLFEEILKYCKMYRITINVDEYRKKIIFKPFTTYFNEYSITDWTNKIDKSKDFNITPITFSNKYVLFNYNDSKTKQGEEYKKKYGVNYGEYRLQTDYNFNTETVSIFKNITPSIVNTDMVLSWVNLVNHKIAYSFPSEISVYNKDKDNKQIDIFGAFFFHNGIANFSTESSLNLSNVYISDDTPFQQANNTYFYSQLGTATIRVYNYPKLDIVRGANMCVFQVPKENYTYINNYSNKESIYTNFWKLYVNERYNIQNKLITCYVDLKPIDYNNFDYNKLIMVGNQLCMVNKIYDYDVTNNGTTKVDLVTIQNINNYISNLFIENNDNIVLWNGIRYINGESGVTMELGSFESLSPVTFSNNQTEITSNNIRFFIEGNKIYATTLNRYVDSEDISMTITVKNEHGTAEFTAVRYSVFPYPWIILENSNGNEVSDIETGSQTYKLKWHGTETYGLENIPTVTIDTSHATGSATIGDDLVENEVVIIDGDDEYFRTEYEVTLTTNFTNNSNSYITITIVDKEGWHETMDYPISL